MSIDLTIKTNHTVTLRGNVLSVDNRDLDLTEFAAAVQFCEANDLLRILRTPGDRAFAGFCVADEKGDLVGAARHMVLFSQFGIGRCSVAPVSNPSLTDMPQREGMPEAARSVVGVVLREEPAGPERDRTVAELTEYADRGEACDILRDSMQKLDKQVGANEVRFLPEAKSRIATVVNRYRPRLAIEPLLNRDLEPALDYLDGASLRGVESRRRNENRRQEETEALSEKLLAEGREQGRREATTTLADKLTGILNNGADDKGDKGDKGK